MAQRLLLTALFAAAIALQLQPLGAATGPVEHVVIIWLKEPGNSSAQDTIIKANEAIKAIPGVTAVRSGKAVPSPRQVVDSSFDVALIISFTDQAALDAYLEHPLHLQLREEVLVPLARRVVIYDLR